MILSDMHCNNEHAHAELQPGKLAALLATLPGWTVQGQGIRKEYGFVDFFEAMAFVNAVAWIAHQEDHHPDLTIRYNRVDVCWSTHDCAQLTLNDLICAAKCETLRSESE